jgi:gamma-D-glutamyl-L-lysine dipeptidyl-peptidase
VTKKVISTAIANIYRSASFTSELITQGVIWEEVEILDKQNNWYQIKQWDGYIGWINKTYISISDIENNNVFQKLTQHITPIFEKPSNSSNQITSLTFGTRIPYEEIDGLWGRVKLPNGMIGFIENRNNTQTDKVSQLILDAYKFLGTPYLWGGKFSFGLDCSGFVQTVFKANGIELERDSSKQADTQNCKEIYLENAQQGDLVFFKTNGNITHVGIYVGNGNIIHAMGEVRIDNIDPENKIHNKSLVRKFDKILSISNLVKNQEQK